ncbi:hypothetical protein DFH28DRAFT_1141224, partial [Melampsora americana]
EEFVYDDVDLGDHDTTNDGEESSEDEAEIVGPDASQQVTEVVLAEDVIKKSNATGKKPEKAEKAAAPLVEQLPISKDSIFHNSDTILDVSSKHSVCSMIFDSVCSMIIESAELSNSADAFASFPSARLFLLRRSLGFGGRSFLSLKSLLSHSAEVLFSLGGPVSSGPPENLISRRKSRPRTCTLPPKDSFRRKALFPISTILFEVISAANPSLSAVLSFFLCLTNTLSLWQSTTLWQLISADMELVVGVISCWQYHENSQLGQPTQATIQPLVVLMKRTVEGKEIKKHIETCPRLIQIATTDPYLTEDSIEWPLINQSTRYPWKDRNRIFRAFHSMACRTGKDLVWTSEKDIKNKVKTAHKTLHKILEESVDIISYNTKADQIKIETEGEHKENKSNKVHHQGMSWLQQRFLLILSGVMLVYERDVYNRALERFCKKTPRTPEQITARKNILKGTILNQLSLDYVRKNPQKALPPSRKNEAQSEEVIKVSEQEIEKAANEETYEFRRLSLQTLALFFMFGTSGLFHVWVWKKEQKMTDAASMIHLSSVLAQRRKNTSSSEPHVFYQRAWSRLDHHMFTILREFITDEGDFKRTLDWPKLTTMFHDRFAPTTLCYLYSLDLCLEIHAPLSTRAPDGSKAPDFDINQRKKGPALILITETFKSVWPSTSGEPVPVTDPKQMYIEADGSRVTKNNPLKAISQAKEKAREDKEKEAEGSGAHASE